MKNAVLRVLKILAGTLLIMLGLTGLVLPIMPGWPFIFLGLILISPANGKKAVEWVKSKFRKHVLRQKDK